jgi:RES domain-containing protein
MAIPAPPHGALAVKYFTWNEQRPIIRVCSAQHYPNAFNATDGSARFRPLYCGSADRVPTMYGANHIEGALGETVFHDIPLNNGPWVIPRASLYALLRTMLIPQRHLALVDLTGWAHKALKLNGRSLVECGPAEYSTTALWAERFHDLPEEPDGLYWRTRQYDQCYAVMLFGDRVAESDLQIIFDETIGLWQGRGLDEVLAAAERANITITT